MLRRIMAYAQKIFGLSRKIQQCVVTEGYQPRAGRDRVFAAALMMCLCRMGSLNALEQTSKKTLERACGFHASFRRDFREDVFSSGLARFQGASAPHLYPA